MTETQAIIEERPAAPVVTQYVDYPVQPERAVDLAAFDGSVIVDRTTGQLGSRCDHEAV